MRPAPFLLVAALAAPLVSPSPMAGAQAAKPAGVHVPFVEGKPFAEVLRRAKAEGKPVMLDVVAAWCGPCKIMDRTTFADPDVVAWAKKVVPARVDAEKGEGRRISARYQAFSFPTVLFIDGDGNEIDRLVGGYQAADFTRGGEAILGGQTPLLEGLAKLRAKWNREDGLRLGGALALRRDRARLRPIALRIVSEEGDLARPEVFQLFMQLVAIETLDDDFSAETGDLIATFLPRLGTDPRRGFFAAACVTGLGKRGDVAGARAVASETLAALGEGGPYGADVLAALGGAEKRAGHASQALAAFQRAAAAAEKSG
ncbi:MAG: thioredoxin family protein, partial [Thermoanaerobaculia bacterium]